MESYHGTNTLSSGGCSDSDVRNTTAPRRLLPFEYVATPPITHLLMAILGYCKVGGSFAPGVRQLSEMSGVTLGMISGLLYELDRTGWIAYDGHVIMLLRDQTDHAVDVAPYDDQDNEPFNASGSDDQNPDRFEGDMVLTATAGSTDLNSEVAVAVGKGDARGKPQPPAAQIMAELGANPRIIREAYAARPDWTPALVRARWEYDQKRIAASDGRQNEGIFFTALRCGELAPQRPDPQRPLDTAAYAADPAYQLGSQAEPDESARRNALYRDAHWRAVDLLGGGAAFGDMRIVVEALVDGATDEQALSELARELSEARR